MHKRFEEVYAVVLSKLSFTVFPYYASARLDDLSCLRQREQISDLVSSARALSNYD